ncbi:tyrosine-type recombinase/integrase, partial [Aquimarina muelleri]
MEKESTDRQLITSYKQELDTLGYTPQTVFTKIRNLINFKTITQKPYQEITETALEFYCIYLQKKELHSNTIKHYYHNVSQFFIYLEREQIISKNPFNFYDLQLIKQAKNTREIINQQEVKQLYKVAKKGKQTLLLHLCYGCGLRAKELEQINIEDVLDYLLNLGLFSQATFLLFFQYC